MNVHDLRPGTLPQLCENLHKSPDNKMTVSRIHEQCIVSQFVDSGQKFCQSSGGLGSQSQLVLSALNSCLSMERRCWSVLCTSLAASMTHRTSGCCALHALCSTPVGGCCTCTTWSMQERCVKAGSDSRQLLFLNVMSVRECSRPASSFFLLCSCSSRGSLSL